MATENSGIRRNTVTSTAAANNAWMAIPGDARDLTLYAKGGGAGANKIQKTVDPLASVVAGTALWIDITALSALTNANFDDTKKLLLTETVTAVRAVRADADTTLLMLHKS